MSGTRTQFVDFSNNTNSDTGENTAGSIQPITNGESVNQTVLQRPGESLRQRSEALRDSVWDSQYLLDADRRLFLAGPGLVTWPGSTTASASGIPVISDVLYLMPMLTPGSNQTPPIPPVASKYGTLHLKRADSTNAILVTSIRRSYAAGDRINVTVSSGGVFSCVLDSENSYSRTIKIVATGSTTLGTVINALNALLPPSPDNTQLVSAALEGGASSGDLILTTQAKQYISGNFDGEGHTITPANLAAFFAGNPTQALAEGDALCVSYAMVNDTASTGGRRQSIPENSNTAVPSGSFFNSRVHPENLVNAIPICKVVNGRLVFATGTEIAAGSTSSLSGDAAAISYGGGGNWADGTTNPATTVAGELTKIIADLATGAGTAKIHGNAVDAYLPAGTLAAQVAQLETLARKPAPLNEADIVPLHAFYDFNNKPRFLVDHNGFPMGQISVIDEHWHGTSAPTGWSAAVQASATATFVDPTPAPNNFLNHRGCRLSVFDTAGPGDKAVVTSVNEVQVTAALSYVFEVPVWLESGTTAAHPLIKLNLTNGGSPATRLGFQFDHSTSNNWLLAFGVDGTLTLVDTGVPVADATLYVLRFESIGSGVSGSGNARVRAYINGALVGNQTTTAWPGADIPAAVELFSQATSTGTARINIGRIRRAWGHLNNSYSL